jgi:hypothetical protein
LLHLLDRDHPLGIADERMDHEIGLVLRPEATGSPEVVCVQETT